MTARSAPVHRDIRIQRAYDEPTAEGSYRVLVDRFWPRGRSKGLLRLDSWARELAPSSELIRWFGHEAERWIEFRSRYQQELATPATQAQMSSLLAEAGARSIDLVYGARSPTENQAVVLRDVLLTMDRAKPAAT